MTLKSFFQKRSEGGGRVTLIFDTTGLPRVTTDGESLFCDQNACKVSDVDMPYFLACWLRQEHGNLSMIQALELIASEYRSAVEEFIKKDLEVTYH